MKGQRIRPDAVANIRGGEAYPALQGQVRFYQKPYGVLVEAAIRGLPDTDTGFFGFHIHAGDRCTGAAFADTGSHYDPTEMPHPLHAGDLPPLLYCRGNAYMAVASARFRVSEIIGRTVVLHDMADDFRTQPAGNAGLKIACGVIQRG